MTGESSPGTGPGRGEPPEIDTSVAHPARVYDCWLGGKDNFAADREAAAQAAADYPEIIRGVRDQRAFLARAVAYLAGPAGVRQFLDIGTGLPAAENTHEVAQRAAPSARVVYVDNDPIVLAHARALLTSSPDGATAYLDADARQPAAILRRAAATLDFSQPVALMLIGVLQLIADEDRPQEIVRTLVDAVPAGSWLAIVHPTSEVETAQITRAARRLNQFMTQPATLRPQAEITRFFDGLELLEPGVVQLHRWRPGGLAAEDGRRVAAYCGLARKP
jgi:hypothetical protein